MEHCFVPVLAGGRVSDKVNPPQSGQFHLQVADQSLHHGINHVGVVAFVCRNEGIRGRGGLRRSHGQNRPIELDLAGRCSSFQQSPFAM